ncbi:MAG: ATP-dependent Clp protease proteolytic subunit [Phycisphaerae bacterium]|jgi:membrane-bound ClpP family serine protease
MGQSIPTNADEFIEQQLDIRIAAIQTAMQADCIALSGPLFNGVDDLLREEVEGLKKRGKKQKQKLVVILTTPGGSVEVTQRIAETLRQHYETIDFIVPNSAFSAGTVLVMSGDAIHMDYYSRLGPIDPQVLNKDGKWVPALGYLEKYKSLVGKAEKGLLTPAEAQLLVDGFDQAELYQYEQARDLSVALLKEWLVKYKFKDWTLTETRKMTVTQAMKEQRAEEIARQLNETERWHTHGRGISRKVLETDLNLRVNDLEADAALHRKIRNYHALLADYMVKRRTRGVIHRQAAYQPFM